MKENSCDVPYNTPHSPFQFPDEYFNKYKERGLDDLDLAEDTIGQADTGSEIDRVEENRAVEAGLAFWKPDA